MGLHVGVMIEVNTPDGTLVARSTQGDYTFNPEPGNFRTEVDLARAVAATLSEEVVSRVGERLVDWATAVQQAVEDAAERQQKEDD